MVAVARVNSVVVVSVTVLGGPLGLTVVNAIKYVDVGLLPPRAEYIKLAVPTPMRVLSIGPLSVSQKNAPKSGSSYLGHSMKYDVQSIEVEAGNGEIAAGLQVTVEAPPALRGTITLGDATTEAAPRHNLAS